MRINLALLAAAFGLAGCARNVILNPEPEITAPAPLPVSANVVLGKVSATSNAANPIVFDAKTAIVNYARKRGTFREVVDGQGDVTLKVAADFSFRSFTRFEYTFDLKGELSSNGEVIGRYGSHATALGNGAFRFTAAADEKPTEEALNQALDKLFQSIESDRVSLLLRLGKGTAPAAVAALPPPSRNSDVDAPKYKRAERPDDFALVVGVEKYESLPAAEYAERDAEAVRRHLIALGYPERNVIFLTGPKASKTGIEKYVETWLPMNVKEGSTVFVYFSGHGAPDPATGQAFLVPWDGDPKFLKNTGYPVKQLYANLNALKARRVLVAMDACFSGEGGRSVLAKGARPLVTKVDAGLSGSSKLAVLAAAGGDEITGTAEDQGHGLFTYQLLKGLAASDGAISVKELYKYLLPRVQDGARRDGRQQTPQLMPADARGEL